MNREDAIRNRLNNATLAPWCIDETRSEKYNIVIGRGIQTKWDHPQLQGPAPVLMVMHGVEGVFPYLLEADAEFIVDAPLDIAYLLGENQRLRGMLTHTPRWNGLISVDGR